MAVRKQAQGRTDGCRGRNRTAFGSAGRRLGDRHREGAIPAFPAGGKSFTSSCPFGRLHRSVPFDNGAPIDQRVVACSVSVEEDLPTRGVRTDGVRSRQMLVASNRSVSGAGRGSRRRTIMRATRARPPGSARSNFRQLGARNGSIELPRDFATRLASLVWHSAWRLAFMLGKPCRW